ncbi:MAG TPA: fibronectin type III domain-containing protein [Nitrospira sp.]|nr:fibronectin type III domain-containing protein [Nitrospira sp.]
MLPFTTFLSFVSQNPIVSMVRMALLIFTLIPLAGCTNDGAEGPITSSASTATDTTAGFESEHTSNASAADSESDGEADPKIDMVATSTGVTARLAWDPPADFNVASYKIYYGKRLPEKSGSEESGPEELVSEAPRPEEPESSVCSSGESQASKVPRATITGLEPDTEYVFAIRAFNETESFCSNEITAVTPPIQS